MKKLMIALAMMLAGCGRSPKWRIMTKKYEAGNPYICSYEYSRSAEWTKFDDSCSKYSVGDTIVKH